MSVSLKWVLQSVTVYFHFRVDILTCLSYCNSRNFISVVGLQTLVGLISYPLTLAPSSHQLQLAKRHQRDVVPDVILRHSIPSGLS